jgi:elongation factor P hydroxylase
MDSAENREGILMIGRHTIMNMIGLATSNRQRRYASTQQTSSMNWNKLIVRYRFFACCLFILVFVCLFGGTWSLQSSTVFAQDKEITVQQRDCEVTLLPNGDVQVVETWNVNFRKGRFSRVMHDISHEHITGITDWEVISSGVHYEENANEDSINYEPHTYTVRTSDDRTTITWYFPKTQNRSRTFTLKYTLQGAMRVYPDGNDVFSWMAVEENHAYSIIDSRVVVRLPKAYEPSAVQASSYRNQEPAEEQPVIEGQTVTFEDRVFDTGTSWEVRVRFPHGAVQADPPPWQTSAERALADPTNAAVVQQRNSDLTIMPSGEMQVVETWDLDLAGGPFSSASFCLPHDRLTGVDAWEVSEQEQVYTQASSQEPHTFVVETSDDASCIRWYFPLTSDQTRTFTIGYTVQGGLWVAEDGDQLSWRVSQADRPYAIQSSEVLVHLPEAFDADTIQATVTCEPAEVDANIEIEEAVVTARAGPFAPEMACMLDVQFPHGGVQADPPSWQIAAEEEHQQVEQAQQQEQLTRWLMMVAAGVVVIALLIGGILLWRNLPS